MANNRAKLSLLLFLTIFFVFSSNAQDYYLFIGTYTDKGSPGIYVYKFNSQTGKADYISNTEGVVNPSYLALSANGKYLYAVNETGGEKPGGVSAFSFDQSTGKLHFINSQAASGDYPCYISVSNDQKWAAVANYGSGSLSMLPIAPDGSLLPPAELVWHEGNSIHPQRQTKPHMHAVVFSPDNNYLYTTDLGIDHISIFKLDTASKTPLQAANPPFIKSIEGSGPRHMTFHPSRRYLYVIEELTGTVAVYKRNNGSLKMIQRIFTHPDAYRGIKGSADIHVSPDGNYLYATNRGDANSITTYTIRSNGKLVWKDYQPTMGVHPRNFVIDPTGNFLLVANRDTDNIAIYKRDKKTGLISFTGKEICVSMPVCLKMLKVKSESNK